MEEPVYQKYPRLIPCLLIVLVCVLSQINYFTNGKTIFHINSIGSSSLVYIKLQIDNFRHLNFIPQYWSNLFYTGGPVHTGMGFYNPILLLLTPFSSYSHAIVAYDILLKIISGIGVFFLLKRYDVSNRASTACALIYPLNPFCAAFGQDPQFAAVAYILPWIIFFLERIIFESGHRTASLLNALILSLILSICYLASNIQSYNFMCWFVLLPFTVLRLYDAYGHYHAAEDMTDNQVITSMAITIGLLVAAVALNIVLVLFEILPTLDVIGATARPVGFDKTIFVYSALITVIAFAAHNLSKRPVAIIGLVILVLSLFFDPKTGVISNPFENYINSIDASSFIFDNQPLRYYLGIFGLLILAGLLLRNTENHRPMILLHIALAYFVINLCLPLQAFVKAYGFPEIFAKPAQTLLPDYYYRMSFIPMLGLTMGLALGFDYLKNRFTRGRMATIALAALFILPIENTFLYFNRTLFTDDIKYLSQDAPEYRFLKNLKPTERMIAVSNKEHQFWRKPFHPDTMPKWLVPCYFGANTFSRVGVALIPRRNELFNNMAMPLYFGLDEKEPLNGLIHLSGIKYVFSYESLNHKHLELIERGSEYHIYRNTQVLPRVMLLSDTRRTRQKVYLPVESDKGFETVEVDGESALLFSMMSTNWNLFQKYAYLDPGADIDLKSGGYKKIIEKESNRFSSGLGTAEITRYENEIVQIDCHIKNECILLLTDTFFPGWNVYINGSPRPSFRTDFIFRGVKLEPGEYTVIFRYEVDKYKYSRYGSLAAFLLILISTVVIFFRLRSDRKKI